MTDNHGAVERLTNRNIARGLGKGVREFQRALEETPEDDKRQERAQIARNSSTNNVVK